jgi:hypothetical protein
VVAVVTIYISILRGLLAKLYTERWKTARVALFLLDSRAKRLEVRTDFSVESLAAVCEVGILPTARVLGCAGASWLEAKGAWTKGAYCF